MARAGANVPKFGNWENDDNVPYTVYFEKARKNKGGKMINPNDPMENPDMFPDSGPPPPAAATAPALGHPRSQPDDPNERVAAGARRERKVSKEEDGNFHSSENPGQRVVNESSYGGRGQRVARPARPSGGSEQSFERSPLHPHHQAKVMGRGSGSPAWEGKSHDSSHGTPGRSKLRPASRGDDSPDKGAAVPRFGEWDENNPQSAENFTHIFNKVREERNTGAGNMSGTPRHPSHGTPSRQKDQPKKCFCGLW